MIRAARRSAAPTLWAAGLVCMGLVALGPVPVSAASVAPDIAPDVPATAATAEPSDPDFLFGPPRFSVSLLGGVFVPRAQGQFYDVTFERFTLARDDFVSLAGALEVDVRISDRLTWILSLEGSGTTQDSEYRFWEEETAHGPVPIVQSTRLVRGPSASAGLKFYPLGQGESLSQFVWVPSRVAPYASAGLGASAYLLEQWGDWVIEDGPHEGDIITEEYNSSGAALVAHGGVGVNVALQPRLALTLEGRYLWSQAELRGDYHGSWDPIDLSGLRLSAGITYRLR